MRKLTRKNVEITLECLPEDCPLEGNVSCIDDETDAANIAYVREQLESGNDWAWFTARVTVHWRGFEGSDVLGCCSYASEAEFLKCGYYSDMVDEALHMLNESVARANLDIASLK
jgi:hypothetical protein